MWSKEDINKAVSLYPNHSASQIAEKIGKGCVTLNVNYIIGKAKSSGIKFPPKVGKLISIFNEIKKGKK